MNPNAYSGLLGNTAPMVPRNPLPMSPVGLPIQAQPGLPGQAPPLRMPVGGPIQAQPPIARPGMNPPQMQNPNYLAQLLRARNGMQPSMM